MNPNDLPFFMLFTAVIVGFVSFELGRCYERLTWAVKDYLARRRARRAVA